jgi:hypothetical protein
MFSDIFGSHKQRGAGSGQPCEPRNAAKLQPQRPPRHTFVADRHKVYNPLSFSKGYGFLRRLILVFGLYRLTILDIDNVYGRGNFESHSRK